jgi:putative membrane protein
MMLDNIKNLKFKISIAIIFAFYISGIIGILSNSQTIDFLSLTPLNLLVSLFVLLYNHQNGTPKQWLVFFIVAVLGYFVEVVGVNTGIIFGEYTYQTTLGWKVLETPVMIAVNWLILTYAVVYTLGKKIKNTLYLALLSAVVLVILDFLIEPVAIQYNFWIWTSDTVPVENYIAWFVVSFGLCYLMAHDKEKAKNDLAPYLLILQFVFFGIFNLALWK